MIDDRCREKLMMTFISKVEWSQFASGAKDSALALMRNPGIIAFNILALLFTLYHAFTWFYLNEAKVYSGQLGFALALTGAGAALLVTLNAGKPSRGWWRLFLLSLWLLCGTSVLAMFFSFFFLLAYIAIVPAPDRRSLLRLAPGSLAACLAGLLVWAGYYAWTMTFAGPPTAVGTTTPQTIVFIFYELLGFAGWGPGRNDLRANGVSALKSFLLPLMIFGTLVGTTTWLGLKEACARFGRRRRAGLQVRTPGAAAVAGRGAAGLPSRRHHRSGSRQEVSRRGRRPPRADRRGGGAEQEGSRAGGCAGGAREIENSELGSDRGG